MPAATSPGAPDAGDPHVRCDEGGATGGDAGPRYSTAIHSNLDTLASGDGGRGRMHENDVSAVVLDAAIAVHRAPVHRKVVLTYLRLSGLRLGLLVNFGAPVLNDGFERLVNGLDEQDRAENGESAERPSKGRASP